MSEWRIVVCGAHEDDVPDAPPHGDGPLHFVCPGCGPHVAADEDGCCVHCGADCTGESCGGHVCGTALEAACAEAGRLREEVRLVRAALEAHPDSDIVGLAAATLRAAAAADDEHAENLRLREAVAALIESYDLAMGPESLLPPFVKDVLRGFFLGVDDARAALAAAKGGT